MQDDTLQGECNKTQNLGMVGQSTNCHLTSTGEFQHGTEHSR